MAWTDEAGPGPRGYRSHSRLWRTNRYVYPVLSRRSRGLSIGINLNPDKACNFRCVYCQVDRCQRSRQRTVDVDRVADELEALVSLALDGRLWEDPLLADAPPRLRRFNDIALSGDGEPTACAELAAVVQRAVEIKQRHRLRRVKLVLITNASLLHQPRVRRVLAMLDRHQGEVWAKLDAGTEAHFQAIARTRVPFRRILDNLLEASRRRPLVIQSLFMRINGQGPAPEEIDAYIGRLRHIMESGGHLARVQVYTIARRPAEPAVTPLPPAELRAIGRRVRQATGLRIECFP